MSKPETIKIDDYVRSDLLDKKAKMLDGMDYVCVRTYSAGCHCGYLKSRNGKEVILLKARRLWYWDGAASLSQLAMEGVSNPGNCKFPCEVDEMVLTEAIEIIGCTEISRKCIQGVKIWKQ